MWFISGCVILQEVFMTPQHLAIAMEYAPGGDLSEYVDACKRAGVHPRTQSVMMLHWNSHKPWASGAPRLELQPGPCSLPCT